MANAPEFNLLYLISIVRKYLWYIVAVVAIATLLAFVLTMPAIYTPQFKSETVIYPTNPERYDVVNIFKAEPDVYLYGTAKEVEKLLSIAMSEDVALFVIDSLGLWEEYGVDPNADSSPKYYALLNYFGNVGAIKTTGNGLSLSAYDSDPQRAADIVNLIIQKTDETNREILNQNKKHLLDIYYKSYDRMVREQKMYADSARSMRMRLNILEFGSQTEVLLAEVIATESNLAGQEGKLRVFQQNYSSGDTAVINTKARVEALKRKLNKLVNKASGSEVNLQNFREGIDELVTLQEFYTRLAREIMEVKSKIDNLEMMSETDFSTILVVEDAKASDKKARPIRWVILMATLLIATVVSVIGVVLVDQLAPRFSKTNS